MKGANDDVLNNQLKLTEVTARHGVPHSALKDRLSGRVIHRTMPGPKLYLTLTKKEELTGHSIDAANMGFGKTWRDVSSIVERYVEQKEMCPCRLPSELMAGGKIFEKKSHAELTIR